MHEPLAHSFLRYPNGSQWHPLPKAFPRNDPPPPRYRRSGFLPSHLCPDVSFPEKSRNRHCLCHLVWSWNRSRRDYRYNLFRRILPMAENSRPLLYYRRSYPPPPDFHLTPQIRHGLIEASFFKSFRISDLLHHPTQVEYIRVSSASCPMRPHKSPLQDGFFGNSPRLQAPPPST